MFSPTAIYRSFRLPGAAVTLALAGCASPGVPKAPSLQLPAKATEVKAMRVGNSVEVSWSMSADTTDGGRIKGAVTAVVCRNGREGCTPVAQIPGTVGAQHAAAELSGADQAGALRLLEYHVELKNARGRSAGVSAPAFAAAGAAPAMPAGFVAEARRRGVELRWQPAGPSAGGVVEVRRLSPGRVQPGEEVLAAGTADPGGMVDREVHDGATYKYTAQRVRSATVAGHAVELRSLPTSEIVITYRDVFPPAIPVGLVAIPGGGFGEPLTIDLSWEPNGEADLSGYRVYRSIDGGAELPITAQTLPASAFRDTQVAAGHRYAYRVSAMSTHGNESGRSAPVAETLR